MMETETENGRENALVALCMDCGLASSFEIG